MADKADILATVTGKPKLTSKQKKTTNSVGKGPSKNGFENIQKGTVGGDPSLRASIRRDMNAQLPNQQMDPAIQQVLDMVMNQQGQPPQNDPQTMGDALGQGQMGMDEAGPNEGNPPDPRMRSSQMQQGQQQQDPAQLLPDILNALEQDHGINAQKDPSVIPLVEQMIQKGMTDPQQIANMIMQQGHQ